jgi:hypothetical protein
MTCWHEYKIGPIVIALKKVCAADANIREMAEHLLVSVVFGFVGSFNVEAKVGSLVWS